MEKGVFTVKDMTAGTQQEIPAAALAETLKKH